MPGRHLGVSPGYKSPPKKGGKKRGKIFGPNGPPPLLGPLWGPPKGGELNPPFFFKRNFPKGPKDWKHKKSLRNKWPNPKYPLEILMAPKSPFLPIRWIEKNWGAFTVSRWQDSSATICGQSSPRACFAKDRTGLTMLQTIYEQAHRMV